MAQYKHKRYSSRNRKLWIKRVRFIIILLAAVGIGFGGYKVWSNSRAEQTSTAQPTTAPATVPSPVATPNATNDPSTATPPQTSPSTAPEEIGGDLLKKVVNNDGVKVAYLTFDDGPTTSVTPKILDTLRKYNIKATFFQTGKMIETNPDMARRVAEEGHLIANHSYAHNYKELYATQESFMNEITKTQELISGMQPNEDFKLVRFPGGGHNAGSFGARKQTYKDELKKQGYYYCDWNALNQDAEGGAKNAQGLLESTKRTVGEQEDVVILMHDAAAKKTTAEALPSIIDYLLSAGYEFRRLDDKNVF